MSELVPSPYSTPEVLVLAVGDVPDGLEGLLAEPGVRVLKTSGGREAVDLTIQHDVAVAIADVQMPDMSGFALVELMRGTARTRAVPIIFLTAATPEAGRLLQGYEAGAVDFLVKPVDPDRLLTVRGWPVRHVLDGGCAAHRLTPFARPSGTRILYPPDGQVELAGCERGGR